MEATTTEGRPSTRRTRPGIQKWSFTAATAAFLASWGCPTLPGERLPEGFGDWGIVLRENVLVDRGGAAHTGSCGTTADLSRASTEDLLRLSDRPCWHCGGIIPGDVSDAAQPGPADHQLENLAAALGAAIRNTYELSLKDQQLYGDLRLRHLVYQYAAAVQRFQSTAAVPPGLDTALTRFLSELRQHGQDAEHRMQRDCLQRLQTHLAATASEQHRRGPYAAARIKAAYESAHHAIGDADGNAEPTWVLCGFAELSDSANLAVAAAPISAWTGGGDVPSAEARAVTLLPYGLAVQLLVHNSSTASERRRRMTVLGTARPDERGLTDTLRAVVSLWDPDTVGLCDTWRAVTAACQ